MRVKEKGPAAQLNIQCNGGEKEWKMKFTSAEANKLLRRLNDEKASVVLDENNGKSFIAATVENVEDVRPEYDFERTREQISNYNAAIRKVKHAINLFNTTTVVKEFDMTIDELLVYMPQISDEIDRLAGMAMVPAKSRQNSYGKVGGFIEYEYANYDVKAAKDRYYEMYGLKQRMQTALDVLNNTVTFEIDI